MTSSPIYRLNEDSFFTIFDLITAQGPSSIYTPLNVVRTASQVCSRWRRLLLASPWIWARIIDLDPEEYFGPQRIEWMEEVLRRAGSAPLWICGDVYKPFNVDSKRLDTQSFFIRLLESWERIEQISVVIRDEEIPDAIQSRFLSPAPMLKLFDIRLPRVRNTLFLNSSQSLFADDAPLLYSIKAERVFFKLDSPWLCRIRELLPIPRDLTLKDIFTLLQHTPLLENLCIDTTLQLSGTILPLYPKPNLPHLSSFKILTTLAVAGVVLDHVKISPERLCGLGISVWDNAATQVERHTLSSFRKHLPVFISSFFKLNPAATVLIIITPKGFRLHDLTTRNSERLFFSVLVNAVMAEGDDLVSCLLDTFTVTSSQDKNASIFETVTELRLRLKDLPTSIFPKLRSMMSIFRGLQVIQTNERSCQTLWELLIFNEAGGDDSGSSPVVDFPQLHTIRLISRDSDDQTRYIGLMLFLIKRRDIGFPVRNLDLTECKKSPYGSGLCGLDEINGLQVFWTTENGSEVCCYTCGTGHPEQLDGLIST